MQSGTNISAKLEGRRTEEELSYNAVLGARAVAKESRGYAIKSHSIPTRGSSATKLIAHLRDLLVI